VNVIIILTTEKIKNIIIIFLYCIIINYSSTTVF
jgi:hypothetical protein